MKIAIDARMYQESGVGRYIRNLLDSLQKIDGKNEYFILLLKQVFDSVHFSKNFTKVLTDFRWYGVSEQIKLPGILKKISPDLVHFPHFNVPIFFQGKFVVTIHDLIHQHFQMKRATTLNSLVYKFKQIGYKTVFNFAVKKSEKILTPSNYVKNSLVKKWRISGNKIIVTHEAVDNIIFSNANIMKREYINQVMEKFNITPPYIFYAGNAHPHKNVEGLIRVFLSIKKNYPNLSLVLSGYDHYFWQRVQKENQQQGTIYTGFVTDRELVALYKNASCFVMPSFEEGFGIPLLEAMAVGCPVVSSNAGALPEVGGNAVVYFDPKDRKDMGRKIEKVLDNEGIKEGLIEKGKKRVELFSWEQLTKETLEVYKKCVLQ